MFMVKEYNEAGIYCVFLYVMGIKVRVVIDDYFPTHSHHQLAFSQTHSKEAWVCLIEKAFAKLVGNYEEIIGGDPALAFGFLTGAPTERFEHKTKSSIIWDRIIEGEKKNYAMAAGTEPVEGE
jgi:calpain-15